MRPSSQGLQIDREPTGGTPPATWGSEPSGDPPSHSPGPFIPGHPVGSSGEEDILPVVTSFGENHTVPAVVLVAGALGSMAMAAFAAPSGAHVGVVLAAAIGVIVSLGFGTLIFSAVGWVVGRMFGADYGSIPVTLLRFGAVAAGYNAAGAVLSETMGVFGIFFLLPVLLILSVWLTAMDFIQAIAFAFVMTVVSIALALVLVGTAMASIM